MAFSVDVGDDAVLVWSRSEDVITIERDDSYQPEVFVHAKTDPLSWLYDRMDRDPKVADVEPVKRRISLRDRDGSTVIKISLECPSEIETLAREIRTVHEPGGDWAPGTFRLFNVDISPKFRYCLETNTDPTPTETLRTLSISLSERALAQEEVDELMCEGEQAGNTPGEVLTSVAQQLRTVDPDVLILTSASLVPLLADRADDFDIDLQLGRLPGYTQLAGESTFQSYGRTGHSPARFNVPGRAIVDRSNSFLWGSGGIPGMVDLVERSHKPLQEVAWGSIGNIFTAIQIREAHRRGVLVPWRPWEPEAFKPARTLHDADRGGMNFEPEVGFHEDVVEVDFASLYPNIMCVKNLSPETVRCDCHDTDDVPGLGYSVCDKPGFVGYLLGPIIDDRADYKRRIEESDDPEEIDRLEKRAESLKWILVTCFGYQGHSNSKFGRIEVHESINAWGREILLDAKQRLEAGGWQVVHGIVDSVWVTPRADEPEPIGQLCAEITKMHDIELEHEDTFDWVAFVPLANSQHIGAQTKYFGKVAERDEYKFRGIETRQRSTPTFVADVQEDLIEHLDEQREPAPVVDRLAVHLNVLRSGAVDPQDLVIKTRVSKPLDEYQQRTRSVAALQRYEAQGIPRGPGQDVRYIVVDDKKKSRARVHLPFETDGRYDESFYADLLIRATESVLSPLGWDCERIERYLRGIEDTRLTSWH